MNKLIICIILCFFSVQLFSQKKVDHFKKIVKNINYNLVLKETSFIDLYTLKEEGFPNFVNIFYFSDRNIKDMKGFDNISVLKIKKEIERGLEKKEIDFSKFSSQFITFIIYRDLEAPVKGDIKIIKRFIFDKNSYSFVDFMSVID